MTFPQGQKCRYEVIEVTGSMVGRIELGAHLLDDRRHDEDGYTDWLIVNSKTGDIGQIVGRYMDTVEVIDGKIAAVLP